MHSTDERREVAARLRAQARTVSHDSDYLWQRLEIAVNGWRFGDVIDESYVFDNDVLARLADLIDPTCTVVSERAHTVGFGCEEAGTEFTLSCGHTVIVDGELPPRYCDECGARVVDEDD